ncbi:MAG: sensor histidine kinase [Aureliella sp.]
MSAQLSCASNGLAHGGGIELKAATADIARGSAGRLQHAWQTLILRCGFQGNELQGNDFQISSASNSGGVTYARVDAAHKAAPSPWMLAQWSEDFGWHRSLQQITACESICAAKDVAVDSAGVQVELRTRPFNGRPASATGAAGSLATEHAHLSQMLAEAAHDIRSPISVAQQIISTLSQRIRRDGQFTTADTELLNAAQVRLTQANQWAEGILVEQSLAHGQPVNVRRRFYPLQWLRGIQPLLSSVAIQHGVKLAWLGWESSLPRLYLDANHLSRVVLNLVGNAIQASRPGSQVSVQVAWQTHVTQRLVISIEDRGSGLSADLLQQINAPAAASHEKLRGCGVGLKTATTLVRALGGSIAAQTRAAGGTLIRLTLPVDNYHSLIHSWLQQNEIGSARPVSADPTSPQITIHALRGPACEDAKSMWQVIDARLQQAASNHELVYRVAADRWLWMSIQSSSSRLAIPESLSEVLRDLRQRDNAWNQPLVCRQQLVFQWQPNAASRRGFSDCKHVQLTSLISKLAEKIAEFVGDHVPPLDELQTSDATILFRPQGGGSARMIRSDHAQELRPAAHVGRLTTSAASKLTSLADTPCESFSGSLAELTQQWHVRQQRLDQASATLKMQ